ncbi:hypothetical protein ACFLTB_06505 [Chloroflexota bacterium]
MDKPEQLNNTIKSEADKILLDHGLSAILSKYGSPVIWGSFVLGLMTWRDLDIYLETNEMTEPEFFQLGKDIALCLKPYRMHYRNEFIGKTPGNPEGFYWGIYTNLPEFPNEWKIDIWSMSSNQLELYKKEFDILKSSISVENRPIILEIKNRFCRHPEYRRGFTSMDIYHAVIKDGIFSVEEFSTWLQVHKQIR